MNDLLIKLINKIDIETMKKINNTPKSLNCEDITAKNPSLIINYNLNENDNNRIKEIIYQLWPQISTNIEFADRNCLDNREIFQKKINSIRGNESYHNFHSIYICLLFDATNGNMDELTDKLKQLFHNELKSRKSSYEFVIFNFFDMSDLFNENRNEALVKVLDDHFFKYKFIFQNELNNGAIWINDDYEKILRLSANIIALFINNIQLFSGDTGIYTFSYGVLEKPVKKIVQVSIKELLNKIKNYDKIKEYEHFESEIIDFSLDYINNMVSELAHNFHFFESSFEYLPDNDMLKNKDGSITLNYFKEKYLVSFLCYKQMLNDRLRMVENNHELIDVISIMKFENILDLMDYSKLMSYFNSNHKMEDLLKSIEDRLLVKRGKTYDNYFSLLLDNANMQIDILITKMIFNLFSKICKEKEKKVRYLHQKINKDIEDPCLIVKSSLNDSDKSIEDFYKRCIETYYVVNREEIDNIIDKIFDEKSYYDNLYKVFEKIITECKIYTFSFDDEINKRNKDKQTVKNLFEQLNDHVCMYLEPLLKEQFKCEFNQFGNNVVLLVHPSIDWIENTIDKQQNWKIYRLKNQDCIERIEIIAIKKE